MAKKGKQKGSDAYIKMATVKSATGLNMVRLRCAACEVA